MLSIGIGCRREVSTTEIEAAIRAALLALTAALPAGSPAVSPADMRAILSPDVCIANVVAVIVTIDEKAHEPGLVAFCAEQRISLRGLSRSVLAAMPGPTAASTVVQHRFGLNGICESAALCGAQVSTQVSTLLLPKTSLGGVSIAIASF